MIRIITTDHERVGKWVQAHGGGYYREGTKCLGLERNGELVAGVLYDYHNGAAVYMHVAGKGNWLTRDFLWICFDYPFNQLKCKVLIGLVAENNLKARKFDEHLGFKLTARIPEGHPDGGLLIYTMRRSDCRWLQMTPKSVVSNLPDQFPADAKFVGNGVVRARVSPNG